MTSKQRLTAQKMVENGGKSSTRQVLLSAGYSQSIANNPQKVMRSKGWQELMDNVPDYLLINVLSRRMEKRKNIIASIQAINSCLKIKNKYPATKLQIEDPTNNMTLEELEEEVEQLKAEKLRRMSQAQKGNASAIR